MPELTVILRYEGLVTAINPDGKYSIPAERPIVYEFFSCSRLEFRHVYDFYSRLRHIYRLEYCYNCNHNVSMRQLVDYLEVH